MSFKIVGGPGSFQLKEVDEEGNTVKLLEEVYATEKEADKALEAMETPTPKAKKAKKEEEE